MEANIDDIGDRWVDVEGTGLPEEQITVLVFTSDCQVAMGMRYEGGWEVDFPGWDGPLDPDIEVTHWRPISWPEFEPTAAG
jgi:hypothetical protein